MANNENLMPPPQPGEVRNPNGRPKGSKNRKTLIREILESQALKVATDKLKKDMGEEFAPGTVAEQLAAAMVVKALSGSKGDVQAFNSLMDSAYGKLKETVETNHVFKQMGQITVSKTEGSGDGSKTAALSFDVGAEPKQGNDDDDDIEGNSD